MSRETCFALFLGSVLCLASGTAPAQPYTPPPADMVSWWPGEGNARDIQGGNNGTPFGNVAFAAGKVGQAFSFDGNSAEFMGNPASLNITGNQVTIDGWINPITATEGVYFGKSSSGQNDYALFFLFGQVAASIKSGGNEFFLFSAFLNQNEKTVLDLRSVPVRT
jgi:hypothetical protein